MLQLVSSYIDNSRPVRVLGQVSGAQDLNSTQPSPMHAAGHALYENGLHVSLAFGTGVGQSVPKESGYGEFTPKTRLCCRHERFRALAV